MPDASPFHFQRAPVGSANIVLPVEVAGGQCFGFAILNAVQGQGVVASHEVHPNGITACALPRGHFFPLRTGKQEHGPFVR
jgi:hypothetical protein